MHFHSRTGDWHCENGLWKQHYHTPTDTNQDPGWPCHIQKHPDRQPLYTGPCSLQECHVDETSVQGPIRPEHRPHQGVTARVCACKSHTFSTDTCMYCTCNPILFLFYSVSLYPTVLTHLCSYYNLHYHAVCSSGSRSMTQLMSYMNTYSLMRLDSTWWRGGAGAEMSLASAPLLRSPASVMGTSLCVLQWVEQARWQYCTVQK